jgi:hypothetical protein
VFLLRVRGVLLQDLIFGFAANLKLASQMHVRTFQYSSHFIPPDREPSSQSSFVTQLSRNAVNHLERTIVSNCTLSIGTPAQNPSSEIEQSGVSLGL